MWPVLATRPKKWWLDSEQLPGGLILGGPEEIFSEDQQDKFDVNANGDVQDEAKFKTAVANVCAVRTRVTSDKLKILTVRNMHEDQWLPGPQSIMHIKGFGSGLNGKADDAMFKDIARSRCQMIVWDGDAFDGTGFTNMVPKFSENDPQSKALAFKLDYEGADEGQPRRRLRRLQKSESEYMKNKAMLPKGKCVHIRHQFSIRNQAQRAQLM